MKHEQVLNGVYRVEASGAAGKLLVSIKLVSQLEPLFLCYFMTINIHGAWFCFKIEVEHV